MVQYQYNGANHLRRVLFSRPKCSSIFPKRCLSMQHIKLIDLTNTTHVISKLHYRLLHPIMPIISVFGSASAPSVDNTFDGILWEASKNPCLPSFRNFVWGSEDRFKKADESYVLSFCEYLLDDFLSEEFERNFVFKSNE